MCNFFIILSLNFHFWRLGRGPPQEGPSDLRKSVFFVATEKCYKNSGTHELGLPKHYENSGTHELGPPKHYKNAGTHNSGLTKIGVRTILAREKQHQSRAYHYFCSVLEA